MNRKLISISALGFVVAVLIFLQNFGYLNFFERIVRYVADSALKNMYEVSISDVPEKTEACIAEDTKIRLLEQENSTLREQLNFLKSVKNNIGADIIGRDIDPLGTTIIINRGSESGIGLNQPVIVGNGLLIGKVARVNEKSSVVRLLSDYESIVAATVLNREKSLGVVEGGFGLTVKLNLIPQNEIIRPGDVIVTSGLEKTIPRGLVIGTVEIVEKKSQEPFQQAILKTSADLHNINFVSVIVGE